MVYVDEVNNIWTFKYHPFRLVAVNWYWGEVDNVNTKIPT